jgi:hypothetical protein
MKKLFFVWFAAAGWLFGVGECAYKFHTASEKIILPNGYFNNYVLEERSSNPRYLSSALNVKQLDSGYIYCVALENNEHIKFIGIDGKTNTFFLFKGDTLDLDILLPITKKYVDKDRINLTLLQYHTDSVKRVCEVKTSDLGVGLKRFEVNYKIVQDIVEANNGKPEIVSTATIINPDQVEVVVSDIIKGERKVTAEGQISLPLAISKGGMAGFCLTMASDPDDETLKKGSDFFCRSVTLGQGMEAKDLEVLNQTSKTKFIQIQKCGEKQGCEDPLSVLGVKKMVQLTKNGYSLKSYKGKNGEYILAGPFTEMKLKEEIVKIQKIVPSAAPF